jgi:nitroreductase
MKVFDAVKGNLAVRRFDNREVAASDVLRILEAGRLCQSGKNLQPWHFIVIRDKSILRTLGEMMKGDLDEEFMKRAPLAIALLSDAANEFDKVDIGRAAQNMTLVAWELGIGSCFMSGPEPPEREAFRRKAHDFLNIPPNLHLVDFLIFGYMKRRRQAKTKDRKDLSEITSQDTFGKTLLLGDT